MQGRAHGCSAGVAKRPNDLGCSAGAGTRTWLQRRIAKRLPRSIAGRQSRPKRMPKTRPMAPQATKIAAINRSWWPWGAKGRSGDASGHDRDAPKSAQSAILGAMKAILGGKLGVLGAKMPLWGSKLDVLGARRSAGAHCDDFRSISLCLAQAPKC